MGKNATKKGKEQHAIPIKKTVSNKQRSLISLTCKIQKSKKDPKPTPVRSADLFLYLLGDSRVNLCMDHRVLWQFC